MSSSSSSSSSSFSSSSSSLDSSSSSSSFEPTPELYQVLVNQGHHNLLPFNYIIYNGISSGQNLSFLYDGTSSKIDYSSIINPSSNTYSQQSSTFIPESEDAKYKHEPIFYADLIVEGQGINQYSLRSQQEMYVREKPSSAFNIPKFTWDNSIFGYSDESESSIDLQEGYVWVGTSDKYIKKIQYDGDSASLVYSSNAPSEVYMITIGQNDSSTFVSCYDQLVKYIGTSYFSGDDDFHNEKEISNISNDLMVLDDKQAQMIVSVESYQGKVIFRNRTSLEIVTEYDGFDAPFKVIWSQTHNCYFVGGTNTLWKLDNGVKTAVYTIKNYSIIDFDCSEKGIIGIVFKGNNDCILRFLNKNIYSILYSETINKDARYCKYCEQGKFYILIETNNGQYYTTEDYLFDSSTKIMVKTESNNSIATTTTTTTLPYPVSKVSIISPISTSVWQKGLEYEIKWSSNAAISDYVRIDLYKGSFKVETIEQQTNNTGIYVWTIPETFDNGSDYKIKITWLSAGDTSNYDISEEFSLTNISQTTTSTTTKINDRSIGIGYDKYNKQIVNVLSNGLIGTYDLQDSTIRGLFNSEVNNITCMAIKDRKINKFNRVSKVRIYVGSQIYLNDKWDSGIINTNLNSIYYAGKQLSPGERYFVNILVYSDKYGWSETQTKSFTMPK